MSLIYFFSYYQLHIGRKPCTWTKFWIAKMIFSIKYHSIAYCLETLHLQFNVTEVISVSILCYVLIYNYLLWMRQILEGWKILVDCLHILCLFKNICIQYYSIRNCSWCDQGASTSSGARFSKYLWLAFRDRCVFSCNMHVF